MIVDTVEGKNDDENKRINGGTVTDSQIIEPVLSAKRLGGEVSVKREIVFGNIVEKRSRRPYGDG